MSFAPQFRSALLRQGALFERITSGVTGSLTDVRNFLYLEHSLALGTAIHGTPLPSVLKAIQPQAKIVAAASGFGLGILQGHPALERVMAMPSPFKDFRGAVRTLRVARPFGREPFAVLHTTGNGRTRVVLAVLLGGGHTRVGFSVHPELMRAPLAFDGHESQIVNNLRVVDALGFATEKQRVLDGCPELAEPVIVPTQADTERAWELLRQEGLTEGAPLAVLITQTSPTQRKSWRPERFQRVAEFVGSEYGMQVVFGGTAAEASAVEAIRTGLHVRSANLAGKTTLMQMGALFGVASLCVTLDTGPMHIARALRVPTVIIAPAWSPPVEWLPVGNPRVRILKNLDMVCAPEDYVIDEVSVDEVVGAVRELMAIYPACSGSM